MKKMLALAVLLAAMSTGCTTYHALAAGDAPGKVFLTKTTTYIIFMKNAAYRCDLKGTTVSNCERIKFK